MRCAVSFLVAGFAATACVDSGTPCRLNQDCMRCTLEACAWCFETGACQTTTVVCPGELALTPEQCEAEAANGVDEPGACEQDSDAE